VKLVALAAGLVLMLTPVVEGQQACDGRPTVRKLVAPASVEAGDPVHVIIEIGGCSGISPEKLPFVGAILIDQSSSMGTTDPNDVRLNAAKAFVDCVAPSTRLAAIKFANSASVIQPLTSDKTALKAAIENLRGERDGATNIYEAMKLAQQILSGEPADLAKYVLLLTDGVDTTGHTGDEFLALTSAALQQEIIYLTVALGSSVPAYFFAWGIAEATNGQFFQSVNPDQLGEQLSTQCAYASTRIATRRLTLYEQLNPGNPATQAPGVRGIPGSATTDLALSGEQTSELLASGSLTADIGTLGSGDGRFLSFDVTSDCLSPDSDPEEVTVGVDDPASRVDYIYGLEARSVQVPQATFQCRRPGALRVEKRYDANSGDLAITLESRYPPATPSAVIRNIVVLEQPTAQFQPDAASASPPVDRLFSTQDFDQIIWRIGELAPREKRLFRIRLTPTVCSAQYQGSAVVNSGKVRGSVSYTKPNGGRERIWLPPLTAGLPSVPECPGRPDLHLWAAETLAEYETPPPARTARVLARHESPSLWVDAPTNGLWVDGDPAIAARITGARVVGGRLIVDGQGDVFRLAAANRLYVYPYNSGSVRADKLSAGATASVYNHTTASWNPIATADRPEVPVKGYRAFFISVASGTVNPQNHVRAYRLPLADGLAVVRAASVTVYNLLTNWLAQNPAQQQALEALGEIVPATLIQALPMGSALQQSAQAALNQASIVWGKPSITLRIELRPAPGELHTNNNVATEVLVVD
jgi:hypothetical protein